MNAFVRRIGAAVLGLAAAIAAVPSAHAAIVSKSWDPSFNPVLPTDSNLGWMASINFFVPNDCIGGGGVTTLNFLGITFGCGGVDIPGVSVLSAQVGIYDLSHPIDDLSDPTTLIDVLTFDATTVLSTLSFTTIDGSGDITNFLSFGTSNAVGGNLARDACLFRIALNALDGRWTPSPRIEYNCDDGAGWVKSTDMPDPDKTTFKLWDEGTSVDEVLAVTELKVVPEPASLALALLALTGVWALRRRG